jgi:hypothetical protein
MTRANSHGHAHSRIHTALNKLKNQSNAKEIELIEMVASIYESVKDKADDAIGSVKDATTTVNNSVHLYPWRYMGGAALGAFIIGCLVRGIRKKR